ncbi:MAG TPA: hypothetical protein VFE98_08645 [Candidatus Bathyarchaeia archaeon]|nr:hypothetical protein [Candidatus Bathyarchaeia archaeon]
MTTTENPFETQQRAARRHQEYQDQIRQDMKRMSGHALVDAARGIVTRGEQIYEANSVKDSVTGQTTSVGPRFVNYDFAYMPQGSLIPSLSLSEPKRIFGEILHNTLEEKPRKKKERKRRKEQADTPEDGEDGHPVASNSEDEEQEEEE